MRLLLVEDDQLLQQQLVKQLINSGYAVDFASDGEEGLYLASEIDFDLAIIDLGLPRLDGISLIEKIREQQIQYPILILTARQMWQEKVKGLNAGADDYLVKPFEFEELNARLNALLRRTSGWSSPLLDFGQIQINTSKKEVILNSQSVNLTSYEYQLLEYLALNPGHVFSKTILTEHLYAQDYDRDSNVLEVFIRRLRKKLDPDNEINPIKTHRGSGYSFTLKNNDKNIEHSQ